MRGVAWLSLALVAMALLSGCASKTETSSSTVAPTSAATSSSAPIAVMNKTNHAPVINAFKANATGLVVKFTFNATDADKDDLTFVLGFGDKTANATGALPKNNATHTFAVAGNYTVKLVVSDGKLSANKTLLIKVTPVAAAAGPVDHRECTGTLGNNPVGLTGTIPGVGSIGGCSFGTIDAPMQVQALDAVAGCTHDVSPDGSSTGYGTPNAVGAEWPAGAGFRIVCDIGTVDLSGSIDFVPA